MTTDASPHTMPSIVRTERMRFRISACQPCEISSLRNMRSVLAPDPASVDPDVSRTGVHADFRPTAPDLPANRLVCIFHPSLNGGGHGVVDDDAPRTGGNIQVERSLLRHPQFRVARTGLHGPAAGR